MLILAVNVMEKIHALPKAVWVNIGIGVLFLILAIVLVKKAAQMNKVVLAAIIFIFGTVLFFNWVYERNEPAFLTPFIDKLAGFFPTKGSYGSKNHK